MSRNLLSGVLALPFTLALVLLFAQFGSYDSLLSSLGNPAASLKLFLAIGAFVCLAQVCMIAFQAVASRAMGTVSPGVISRWSLAYIRVWLKTGLVTSADRWLSGSRFYPVWLRVAGMKVGNKCEIGVIIDTVPELIQINQGTFLADNNYLGGPRIQQGTVTLANTLLERDTFMGNQVVVPAGQRLPPDILIGVATVADDRVIQAGSSWFGHPSFDLINREIVTADRSLTSDPTFIRIVTRAFWDWMRFTAPFVPTIVMLFWISGIIYAKSIMPLWALVVLGIPAVSLACGGSLCLFVLGLKWGLLGRQRDGIHPLYSCWASRWDYLSVAKDFIANGLLSSLEGTLLLPVYFRLLGMKIGKQVVLGDGISQINVDFDLIDIGNYVTIKANFQAHTFEDRMLKMGHIRMEDYSTLGTHTVPLYGTNIGEHTFVASGSVIMKGETLPSWTSWEGNPAQLNDEAMVLSDTFVEEDSKVGSPSSLKKGETLPAWASGERNLMKLEE